MKTAEEKIDEFLSKNGGNSLGSPINAAYEGFLAGYKEATEIAFKEGQSNPKIKQLEWEHGLYNTLLSKTLIGDYGIAPIKDGYHMYLYNKRQYYWLKDYVNTIDEAKQFAQADFENRVKECLITE